VFSCPIDGKKEDKYVGPEPGARPFAESIDTQSKEQEQQTTNSNIHVASGIVEYTRDDGSIERVWAGGRAKEASSKSGKRVTR
jgi:hypothetical protein